MNLQHEENKQFLFVPIKQHEWNSYLEAALDWYKFGLAVFPVLPGAKKPALKLDKWFENFSEQSIKKHWEENPDHEVGFVTGDNILVVDADTPEAIDSLKRIEESHGLKPNLISKTAKGEHHFFWIESDIYAKSDSHCTETYPSRLDIKTGKGQIILPPSTGKSILLMEAKSAKELTSVPQVFVDSIFLMNDRPIPRPPVTSAGMEPAENPASLSLIHRCLAYISPDIGYDDWLHVGMAIFHETKGSDEGRTLFDNWSSKGHKYKGSKDIEAKWSSFRLDCPNPVTVATLISLAKKGGADLAAITKNTNPLERYFIHDIEQLEAMAVNQVPILGNIALLGQATVLYAKQNTGKTLITLYLIIEGIKAGNINPEKLIYINMDDDSKGLATKARFAQEYKFNMVADGYEGFQAKEFRTAMEQMIATNTANHYIIVLDTLKKFVNTMEKKESSDFAKVIRRFVLKGGTVIALAHANKHPGKDGKPVYSGTTDIIDDFDCGYTLSTVSEDFDKKIKVVEFENIKRRGNVIKSAHYSYSIENDISYNELLLSVETVNNDQMAPIKRSMEESSDTEAISAIEVCIKEGVITKMKLAEAASERSTISKRRILKIIEKYEGNDSTKHRWSYQVKARGAKVYVLLQSTEKPTANINS